MADQAKAQKEAADAKKKTKVSQVSQMTHLKGNGTTRHYNLTDIITVLVDKNPKQEGSAARKRFSLYKTGMSVEAAFAAGLWPEDIRHDAKPERGYIRLGKA